MGEVLIRQLDRMFYPRTVAIIGASAGERKFGRFFLESFIKAGFKDIYPVNPHEKEILGLKAYPRVTDVPVEVDYAVIVTPTAAALQAVTDCAEKGVVGVAIYTSGFREKGPAGEALEKKLVEAARQGGTRLIGPNCLGIYCPASHLTTGDAVPMIGGHVGFIANSGSLCTIVTRMLLNRGLAISKAISCGNESDLTSVDFLEYLGQDPETEIVLSYMEGMKDGQRFVRLAREISQKKPIVIWKGGLTARGARAAASHTGALAGAREVWQGALRQSGITLVRSAEELIDCLLSLQVSPLPAGRSTVIVSGPGGPAVATTDALVENGLVLTELSQETRDNVGRIIPAVGTSVDNPLDLGQTSVFAPQAYPEALKVACQDPNADMVLTIVGGNPTIGAVIVKGGPYGKPVALALATGPDPTAADYKLFNEAGIPVFPDPRRAARALSALADRADFLKRIRGKETPAYVRAQPHEAVARARSEGREALSEYDSKRLLAAYGVPVTREAVAGSRKQAVALAKEIGFPVGLKACGSHILHKTELGLVELGLSDAKEVGAAYDLLMERTEGMFPDGILVQEMVRGERELVAGLVYDPQFGPCVMFGLGGIFTEALRDVSFRVAPFDRDEARAMIGEIRAQALLGPFRGGEPVDLDALAGALVALSRLAFEQDGVKEVDVNPLIVGPDGRPVAVDALVVLG